MFCRSVHIKMSTDIGRRRGFCGDAVRLLGWLGAMLLMPSCVAPCEPGGVSVLGESYFTVSDGTPLTSVLIGAGTCRSDQLSLGSGRVGVTADVPEKDAIRSDVGLVALAFVNDPPLGESRVSIVVAGRDRFFTIHRAQSSFAPKALQLELSCAPFFESEGRVFCNDQNGERRGVAELSGSQAIQRWPGIVAAAGRSSPILYRYFDSTVSVLAGPQAGASMSFDEPVLGVSGEPAFLFVATERRLRVVDLPRSVVLHETVLPQGSTQRVVSKGRRVTLQMIRPLPYRKWILQYAAESSLLPVAEPLEVVWDSGVNGEGLLWQCGSGSLHFIDTLGDGGQSSVTSLPGVCEEGLDDPQLFAGFGGQAAFCPLGDPREGRFLGVQDFGRDRTICDGDRIYGFDYRYTAAAKLSEIPEPQ